MTIHNSRQRRGSQKAAQLTINKKGKFKSSTVNYQLSNVRERGFTLIELIVVFGVIAILAGIIIMAVDPFSQIQKANDAQRKSDLAQIQRILEQFYQDNNGKYPSSDASYQIKDLSGSSVAWGSSFPPYSNVLPKDSAGNKRYMYYSPTSSNGQTYYLYASLDRGTKDPQVCSGGVCSGASGIDLNTGCGGKCNYGVTSANTSP